MNVRNDFGASVEMDVVRLRNGTVERKTENVAAEVPFTILANEMEIATLLCSPVWLKEFCFGFLRTSGFIRSIKDITSFSLDTDRWVASCEIADLPDPSLTHKRLYTSGCGKGVMYTSINEIAYRKPIKNEMKIHSSTVISLARWLQKCSALYKTTGGIHTAALSIDGEMPDAVIDDIGRHNAVDKVIGKALLEGTDLSKSIIISSGRASSEILHKVRSCETPINISRGAPTHQTVLRARDMGITVIGFARGGNFTVYSHEERVVF